MLTLLKKIFTWWNRDTFGTRLKTILFGKIVGTDSFGNKYYESKDGKRWVIYSEEIDATKIPVEWYSCCLLYTSPSPRDRLLSRMPSSA